MMERLGLDVIKVEVPWGEGVPENKLEKILKEDTDKKIKAVTVVHNETTTGVFDQALTHVKTTVDSRSRTKRHGRLDEQRWALCNKLGVTITC